MPGSEWRQDIGELLRGVEQICHGGGGLPHHVQVEEQYLQYLQFNIYNLKYTTIVRGLSLEEALVTIKNKRDIKPNPGFLEQLLKLEADLNDKR